MATYTKTTWVNDQVPAINDTNLNNIESGIEGIYNEFDANTILKADVDNTPIKLAVAASRIVGRKSSGGIAALTVAEVEAMLTGLVPKTLYDAYSILYADTDNTPTALTVAASRFIGRKATGGIAAMTVAEAKTLLAIVVADISDHDKAAHDALGIAPASHGAAKHTDRTRYMWLGSPHHFSGGVENYGMALDPDVDEYATYSFALPTDFVSFSNLYVYYAADITANNVVLDIVSNYGVTGEAQNVHSDSDTTNVIAIGDTNRQRFTTAGLLASIAAGDIGFVTVTRDANHGSDDNTGDLVINGILIEYTADM